MRLSELTTTNQAQNNEKKKVWMEWVIDVRMELWKKQKERYS